MSRPEVHHTPNRGLDVFCKLRRVPIRRSFYSGIRLPAARTGTKYCEQATQDAS